MPTAAGPKFGTQQIDMSQGTRIAGGMVANRYVFGEHNMTRCATTCPIWGSVRDATSCVTNNCLSRKGRRVSCAFIESLRRTTGESPRPEFHKPRHTMFLRNGEDIFWGRRAYALPSDQPLTLSQTHWVWNFSTSEALTS